IELALANRIELVVVALAATDRQAEPYGAGGVDAVNHRLDAELLDVDAAFLIDERVAVEARGDLLVERRVRQQIAGELLDCELVERQILVEGVDHPVAVLPNGAWPVDGEAVGVGVAGKVEPMASHPFAV